MGGFFALIIQIESGGPLFTRKFAVVFCPYRKRKTGVI